MKRADLLVVCAVLGLALASGVVVAVAAPGAEAVAVITGPTGVTTVPLDEPATLRIRGTQGEMLLVVADGHVRCVSSDCPDGICVATGEAAPGRPIVCVPNEVCVRVDSSEAGVLDAVSR